MTAHRRSLSKVGYEATREGPVTAEAGSASGSYRATWSGLENFGSRPGAVIAPNDQRSFEPRRQDAERADCRDGLSQDVL